MNDFNPARLSRRAVLQWFAATAAALSAGDAGLSALAPPAASGGTPSGVGYGTDPDLLRTYQPGEAWPLIFQASQKACVSALCDTILPADHLGPSASSQGVPAFIDEWVSAPYPLQQADRPLILEGLTWMADAAVLRFKKEVSALDEAQMRELCEAVCNPEGLRVGFKNAVRFFNKMRSLAMGAYFSTPAGWEAIGYVGNTPLARFDGPPVEVLEALGIQQTVV
ncbi:MAG: Gluconate 2-dehydrogenase subunit 3 [Verrucomicrobia bacterium]|nr:MAG: Gluconate 2-dehydrogenase subunit 3 [Verrucomicrobiota bacterium]